MTEERWSEVDRYVERLLIDQDPALEAALEGSREAGLPAINVSPMQGKLLHLLAHMQGARKVLELGTLGGYSTIWLARALPQGGRLISVELDPERAELARANLARAGVGDVAEVRVGRALDVLQTLEAENAGPFDLIFVDADKPGTADYFDWAVRLSRPGSVIIVDNVVRNGAVADAESQDPAVQGIRRFYDALTRDNRVSAAVVQTVGAKGYDGFALAIVAGESQGDTQGQ